MINTPKPGHAPHRYLTYKNWYYLVIMLLLMGCNQPKASGENTGTSQTAADRADAPAQPAGNTNTVTVVNWNIEWLGSASNGPRDKTRQFNNAVRILQYLKADLYCLCEIVDPASLSRLTASLGGHYAYSLSSYAAGAKSTRDPGYPTAQKLAFIYNTDRFKAVQTGGYLQQDARAGYYFASGRYPFELKATIHTPSLDQAVDVMIVHGKSGADLNSYDRRLKAATALKTALDRDRQHEAVLLLGDFNDHMSGSITRGKASPYAAFAEDPAYHVLTLPLAGQKSTLDYPGVIDQQIASGSLYRYYKTGSARIRTDITAVVPDYTRGSTSDHYPVSSVFIFDQQHAQAGSAPETAADASVPAATGAGPAAAELLPQDMRQQIFTASVTAGNILIRAAVKSQHIQFILYNKRQHKVLSIPRKFILKGDSFNLRTPHLYRGDYTLVIFSDHGRQTIPFTVD